MNPTPDAPAPAAKKPFSRGQTGFWTVFLLLAGTFTATVSIPSFIKARTPAARNSCINNLRHIEGAKEQWALEHKKKPGDEVNQDQMAGYIKGGMPICPGHPGNIVGTYKIGRVDEAPRCTAPGHTL